jgi:hypothetical protein
MEYLSWKTEIEAVIQFVAAKIANIIVKSRKHRTVNCDCYKQADIIVHAQNNPLSAILRARYNTMIERSMR